jgi:predicted regulator of Ras-like GTPase activity (Roadblock/LC7/MglB family)
METSTSFTLKDLNHLICEINSEGSFVHSILSDEQGFPIVSSFSDSQESENQAAVISIIQKLSNKISDQFQFSKTSEFIMHDVDGKSLVIKPFEVGDSKLILSVLIPNRHSPYRRITGKAIRQIKTIWAI